MYRYVIPAAVAAMPFAASAATYNVDLDTLTSPFYVAETLEAGVDEVDTYNFTSATAYDISSVVSLGIGNSAGADVTAMTLTIDGVDYAYTLIGSVGGLTYAAAEGVPLSNITSFSITIDSTGEQQDVGYNLRVVYEPSAVPLPAAGGMLGLALLGGAAVLRGRRKSDEA
ncbi:hypothetical protein [Mangrovicoccus sp. HB161399]|uniref:hypothetical protein n=1 Tax=Mangrovicoccus sp. HB161399 TaxID=2720392 RepID=UPI001C12D631|nr:hypothetical protein [Mangrovicoccus sp. HB161399]